MRGKLLTMLCLLGLLTGPARGAEEQVVLSAAPGLALTTDAGSPVAVEDARMTIDFTDGEKDAMGLSPRGRLTAAYTLTNPTGQEQTVTVAAPFAAAIEEGDAGVPAVTVDGAAADVRRYYGPLLSEDSMSGLGTGAVLSAVNTASPLTVPDGTMYTFVPVVDVPLFEREELQIRFYVRAKFRYDGPLIYGGFGGVTTLEDGRLEFTAWIYPGREEWPLLTVFVPGGGVLEECEVNGFDDYIGIRTPLGVEMELAVEETMTFRAYLDQYMEGDETVREQSCWAVLEDMEQGEDGMPAEPLQETAELLRYAQDYDRLAMAVFSVTLAPGQSREVCVTSALDGTVERAEAGEDTQTAQSAYLYDYTCRLEAARAWADFGGLELTILPPEGLEISAPFETEQGEAGRAARWEGLPEAVHFRLVPEETPAGGGLFPLIPFAAAAVVVVGAGAAVLRRKR